MKEHGLYEQDFTEVSAPVHHSAVKSHAYTPSGAAESRPTKSGILVLLCILRPSSQRDGRTHIRNGQVSRQARARVTGDAWFPKDKGSCSIVVSDVEGFFNPSPKRARLG
jgi:hypothetical protein